MFSYLNFHTWENVTVSENRKNETTCSVAQPLRRLTKISFKKLCHGRKQSKWMMNLYCPDYLTVMDYFSVYPIVRLSVSESIHKSVLFKLLNFWTVVRKALDGYSYFEKGCRKMCTRQSRKVIWDMINIEFLTLQLSNLLLLLSFSTRRHISMAHLAILSKSFEEMWTKNHPQYHLGLSRALFLTTFHEIAVYNPSSHNRTNIEKEVEEFVLFWFHDSQSVFIWASHELA